MNREIIWMAPFCGWLLIWVVLALIMGGCSTLPQTVEVPVAVPCSPPPVIQRPHLAIRNLKPGLPPADVKRLYAESLEQLGGYAEYLETILAGYREGSSAR